MPKSPAAQKSERAQRLPKSVKDKVRKLIQKAKTATITLDKEKARG